MTGRLIRVEPLTLDTLNALIDEDGTLRLRGTISMRAPTETLRPFFERVHDAIVDDGRRGLTVDLTELTFMNSSSIRVLITWLDWIAVLPKQKQYVLTFRTNPTATRDVELDVRLAKIGREFEIRVGNAVVGSRKGLLTKELTRVRSMPPTQAYADAMIRSRTRLSGSCGIGLSRIRAEAQVELTLVDDREDWVTLVATSVK